MLTSTQKDKEILENELKRVLEVIIPELKCKLESAKEEIDSYNAKISFL